MEKTILLFASFLFFSCNFGATKSLCGCEDKMVTAMNRTLARLHGDSLTYEINVMAGAHAIPETKSVTVIVCNVDQLNQFPDRSQPIQVLFTGDIFFNCENEDGFAFSHIQDIILAPTDGKI